LTFCACGQAHAPHFRPLPCPDLSQHSPLRLLASMLSRMLAAGLAARHSQVCLGGLGRLLVWVSACFCFFWGFGSKMKTCDAQGILGTMRCFSTEFFSLCVLTENDRENYCLISVDANCDGVLQQDVWQACGHIIGWNSSHSVGCCCRAFQGQLRHPGLQLGQARLRQVLCALVCLASMHVNFCIKNMPSCSSFQAPNDARILTLVASASAICRASAAAQTTHS
jgi:hypothetical protein